MAHQLLSYLLVIESITISIFKLVIQTMVLHAHIVADRYHVCRLVDWALEQVKLLEILRISNDLRLAYGLRLAFKTLIILLKF